MNTIKIRINYILSVKLYKIILWRSFFFTFRIGYTVKKTITLQQDQKVK